MNATISTTDVLRPEAINLHLAAKTATQALTELHAGLSHSDALIDSPRFLRDLLARHALGQSSLDDEIALPHVRTGAVNRIVLAVGRSASGVGFNAKHPTIRLLFLIGVPSAATAEYLRLVAQLARTLRSPPLRQALLKAPTAEVFQQVWSLAIAPVK